MFWSSIHCGCLFPVFLPSLCINGGVRSPNSVAGVTAGNVCLWKKQKAERTCRHSTFLSVLYVYFSLIAETSSVDILPRPLGWRNARLWCRKYTNSPCIQGKKQTWCDVLWHVFAFSRELSRKTSKDRQAASDYRKFHLKAFIVRWRAVNVHPSSQHFNDQSIPPSPPPSISTLIPNNAITWNNIKLMTCFEMIFFHSARSRLVYSATK